MTGRCAGYCTYNLETWWVGSYSFQDLLHVRSMLMCHLLSNLLFSYGMSERFSHQHKCADYNSEVLPAAARYILDLTCQIEKCLDHTIHVQKMTQTKRKTLSAGRQWFLSALAEEQVAGQCFCLSPAWSGNYIECILSYWSSFEWIHHYRCYTQVST